MSSEQRESLDIDVVFVGGGPAGLAGAYQLAKLVERHNAIADQKMEVSIAVLEKGKEIGSHAISGAVVDPAAFRELYDDWRSAPFEAPVGTEKLLWMTSKRALSMPIPPPLENQGKYVASLGKLVKWMAGKCEDAGVDIFCEFPAAEVLTDEPSGRVIGIRTGDRGIGHDGVRKANYEPGIDIMTRALVLAEGPRGTLARRLEKRHDLAAGKNPQVYAIGIKEVWELPEGRFQPGDVTHTMGWPLDLQTFGGGFVYGMKDDLLIVGLVVGLDYRNPRLDPHREFQRFKTHPAMRKLLDGGRMAYYGAKAIPEGGWFSMPRPWGDGYLITGDSIGMLNSMRLKGIHLAMKSGMLAAETIFEGLLEDNLGVDNLARFEAKIESSWIKQELWEVRNFHQAFGYGALAGMFQAGIGMLTNGAGFGLFNRLEAHPGHERMRSLADTDALEELTAVDFDGVLTFDKLADVYNSGTAHEEDQPAHLHVVDTDICIHQCAREFGNPCERFCPAQVYEMVADSASPTGRRLQINFSNCVHCKICDIMDPYQIIDWVTPEGGGGPNYGRM